MRAAGHLFAGLVSAVLLAGCAAGAAASPTVAPMASPLPTAWGPAVLVTGLESCGGSSGPVTTDPSGENHGRSDTLMCTDTASDPRVSGIASGPFNYDAWGTQENGASVVWGTIRLVNAGGAWEGRYTGAYTSETGDMISVWYTGIGGYAGLAYFQWIAAPYGSASTGYRFQGLIFPGSPPLP